MIALSILHGGPGPVFFAPVVIDYLFGGISGAKACVEDVPDRTIQLKLKKVRNLTLYSRIHRSLKSVFSLAPKLWQC